MVKGGGAIWNPSKVRPPYLKPGSATARWLYFPSHHIANGLRSTVSYHSALCSQGTGLYHTPRGRGYITLPGDGVISHSQWTGLCHTPSGRGYVTLPVDGVISHSVMIMITVDSFQVIKRCSFQSNQLYIQCYHANKLINGYNSCYLLSI